jgi:hypothetical protein
MIKDKPAFFISLGPACNVKWAIDTFIGSKETLFFDWMMTNLKSVTQIIGCEDITKVISYETVTQNPDKPHHSGHACMLINSVDYCESIHDVPSNFSDNDIEDFIAKYRRRYYRIIDIIKSNKFNIYFMHYKNVSRQDKNDFIECVKKINPECCFTLVELFYSEEIKFDKEFRNSAIINLNKFKLREKDQRDWRTTYLDWRNIFITLLKN